MEGQKNFLDRMQVKPNQILSWRNRAYLLFAVSALFALAFAFISSAKAQSPSSSTSSTATPTASASATTSTTSSTNSENITLTPTSMNSDCVTAKNSVSSNNSAISKVSLYSAISDNSVKTIFKWVLSFVNILVLIFLLIVSFSSILRIQVDTYAVKKTLPALIMGVILANFSWLICRFLIEVSTLVSTSLLAKYPEGGAGLFRSIAESYGLRDTLCNTATTGYFASGLLGVFVGTVLVVVAAILMLTLYMLFVARVWVVTLLMILAPLGFIALGFPLTSNFFKKWWGLFFNWVFMTPAVFLILILADGISTVGDQANLTRYILTTALLFFAIQVPFKMGGDWMRQWGNYVSQFKKKSADAGAYATGLNKGGYTRNMYDEAKLSTKNAWRDTKLGQLGGRLSAGTKIRRDLKQGWAKQKDERDRGNAREARIKKDEIGNAEKAADQARNKAQLLKEQALQKQRNDVMAGFANVTDKNRYQQILSDESRIAELSKKPVLTDYEKKEMGGLHKRADRNRQRIDKVLTAAQKAILGQDLDQLPEIQTAQINVKNAEAVLQNVKNQQYGRTFEAEEARQINSKGEEGSKLEMKAGFDETDEGRRILRDMAEYAEKTTRRKGRSDLANKRVIDELTEVGLLGPGAKSGEIARAQAFAADIGTTVEAIKSLVQGNMQLKSDITYTTGQTEKRINDYQYRLANEKLLISDAVDRLKSLDNHLKMLRELQKNSTGQQALAYQKMIDATNAEKTNSENQKRSLLQLVKNTSGNNVANLPEHLRRLMVVGTGGSIEDIQHMDGAEVRSMRGVVGAYESKKAADRAVDTGVINLSQHMVAGEPGFLSKKQAESYNNKEYSYLGNTITEIAGSQGHFRIKSTGADSALHSMTNPAFDPVLQAAGASLSANDRAYVVGQALLTTKLTEAEINDVINNGSKATVGKTGRQDIRKVAGIIESRHISNRGGRT